MSEGTLASAVALPDQDNLRQSPEFPTKRRKSSVVDHEPKRRRLSGQDNVSPHSQRRRPSSPTQLSGPERPAERRPARQGGRDEDRKRGQRLFGGLLGTLSQSSTSAAQKRRADIEKRQQDKLKSQDNEYDGLKKRRKERRDMIRRREKPFYEREVMQTRHSNLVAMAHFLKTRTEPVLYYKPWQLRSGDEAVIREQIEEAEATVSRETAEFESRYPPEAFDRQNLEPISISKDEQPADTQESSRQQGESTIDHPRGPEPDTDAPEPKESTETAGIQAQQEKNAEPTTTETPANGTDATGHEQAEPDVHRAAEDDGGEVVEEDNEDTVIY